MASVLWHAVFDSWCTLTLTFDQNSSVCCKSPIIVWLNYTSFTATFMWSYFIHSCRLDKQLTCPPRWYTVTMNLILKFNNFATMHLSPWYTIVRLYYHLHMNHMRVARLIYTVQMPVSKYIELVCIHMWYLTYPPIIQLEQLFNTASSQDAYTLLNLRKTFQAVLYYISTSWPYSQIKMLVSFSIDFCSVGICLSLQDTYPWIWFDLV